MSQKTASRTALATAHMRAAHQLLDPPPRILEDPLAVAVLGPCAGQRIRELADRSQAPEGRALRAHRVLRSRFAVAQERCFRGSSLPSPQRTTIVAAVR